MGEGGILQEEVVSEARASGGAGNLVVDGVMAEMNSETKESSQGDLRVLNGQVRMEVGGVGVKVWGTIILHHQLQCEHVYKWRKKKRKQKKLVG